MDLVKLKTKQSTMVYCNISLNNIPTRMSIQAQIEKPREYTHTHTHPRKKNWARVLITVGLLYPQVQYRWISAGAPTEDVA